MIMVYSNDPCVQCAATKRMLNKLGLPYVENMLADFPDVTEWARAQGYRQAPIVKRLGEDGSVVESWSGYNPAKIKQYREEMA